MSRTKKSSKPPGYEFWSRRPGSNKGGCSPGSASKRHTHKAERQQAREQLTSIATEAVSVTPAPQEDAST